MTLLKSLPSLVPLPIVRLFATCLSIVRTPIMRLSTPRLSDTLMAASLCAACQSTSPSGSGSQALRVPSVAGDSAIAVVRIASFPDALRGSTLVFRVEPRQPGAVQARGGTREYSVPVQTLSPQLIDAPAGEFVFHSIVYRGTPVLIDPPMKATLPAGSVVYVGDLSLQIQTVSAATVIPGTSGGGNPVGAFGGMVQRDMRVGYGIQVRPETVEQARPQLPEAARPLEVLVHPLAVPQQSR